MNELTTSSSLSLRATRCVPFLALLLLSTLAYSQREVPELWGARVHDEAHVLQQLTIDQLEQELKAFEDSTSNQIAILIVPSLEGEVLEEYSIRVVEKWKLGTAKNDNGVLVLVAVDDHFMRIEVGQGLEGVLTDAQCNRIIRDKMAPEFRRNDYDAGIKAGVDAVVRAIGGEYDEDDIVLTGQEKLLVGAVILILLGVFSFTALATEGCFGWGLYFFLLPFYALLPWIAIGTSAGIVLLIIYAVGMPVLKILLGKSPWWKEKMKKWAPSGKGGSTSSVRWSTGSGWSGGGGFSGGGGSFGGGGSSGRW